MINDKTVKIPCKFAIKDELGDLICGNEYSENLADFCRYIDEVKNAKFLLSKENPPIAETAVAKQRPAIPKRFATLCLFIFLSPFFIFYFLVLKLALSAVHPFHHHFLLWLGFLSSYFIIFLTYSRQSA